MDKTLATQAPLTTQTVEDAAARSYVSVSIGVHQSHVTVWISCHRDRSRELALFANRALAGDYGPTPSTTSR